ncbi:MAG: hypothetical protein RDV48_24980 [Candidatus Eremiobacteraeota bacterium]|nr:hypothetical protein [Candidatus Eremiobacteraeota bacterium]
MQAELDIFGEIEFTVDGEEGLISAEGDCVTFQVANFKGLYRIAQMTARYLADPRILIALQKIIKALELSVALKVGNQTIFVLDGRG